MSARATTPPTTPPAMGPALDEPPPDDDAEDVDVDWEPEDVGEDVCEVEEGPAPAVASAP
ncbi:hypothetical protein BDZ89DRAFT_1078815 [Hymenopellis radicata]|nr:hypothetical protein BDZ89DRAFT_1078815 [Hymenopellis radicata]